MHKIDCLMHDDEFFAVDQFLDEIFEKQVPLRFSVLEELGLLEMNKSFSKQTAKSRSKPIA